MNTTHPSTSLRNALQSTALALSTSPKALLAIATLAATGEAQAQIFGGAYERAGGSIGYEVGRQAKSASAQGIAAVMGQVLGSQLGRHFDENARAAQEQQQAVDRARADAAARAAYDAERKRLDPSYMPGRDGYSGISQRGAASTSLWNQAATGLASVDRQLAASVREFQLRNQRALAPAQQSHDASQYPGP